MLMGRNPRGPFYEALLKIGPVFLFLMMAFVVTALIINFVQSKYYPGSETRQFDAVKNFSHVNSTGMVKVMMKKSADDSAKSGNSNW